MPLLKLFEFLNDKIADGTVTLSAAQAAQVTALSSQLERASAQLEGTSYHRLVLTLAAASDGDETFALLDRIHAVVHQYYPTDSYLVGDAMSAYGSEQTFTQDNVMVSAMSILMVMLVLLFTFRSLVIPALLVLIVQCGVFITVTVVGLQGLEIYYLALLIVECILMGATIDYGILYTSYYREMRESMSVRDALIAAYRGSIHTVLTSGSIMVLVTAVVGKFFGNPTIEQICRTISIGAFSAIILILLFLPGMLALLDRWVLPRDLRRRLYPPKAPKAPKAPKPPKAARASWP